jgi:type I restriction enzyme, R subunit
MNEAETRAELIDPALQAAGWRVVEGSRVRREHITLGRLQGAGRRAEPEIADYVLTHRNHKLAVIEAKRRDLPDTEGVGQAKHYAAKLGIRFAFSTNGLGIYRIDMQTGAETYVPHYPSPDDLWDETYAEPNAWRDRFADVPLADKSGTWRAYYFQDIAINRALEAIAAGRTRILLTLATGTGNTPIAFQIAWKLFQSQWNLSREPTRRPRILFLAGRDKDGNPAPYFGEYPADFFDFIVIDECHRGGARDESNWRGILECFSPAVQLGLTATPKREINVDTYQYFGEPVFVYSLKDGINDGFLTPFKVLQIATTLDDYVYTPDDTVLEGEVQQGRRYQEADFNRIIEIKEREQHRVRLFMDTIDQREKTLVFCASQDHALAVRDLVNQMKQSHDPEYCVRVTARDGEIGNQHLKTFQDNEKTIPTILTTSQKLSTGVDARNVRNIVLMRPVNSMIEFKQIIGRGTRLFDGKDYFTIFDFVKAYEHFNDPEWDGEPMEPVAPAARTRPGGKMLEPPPDDPGVEKPRRPATIRIRLADGKERVIQHMTATTFWGPDGKPISAAQFIERLFGELPALFKDEDELRRIWSLPDTRKALLYSLAEKGYGAAQLAEIKTMISAEQSDVFDVLAYIAFALAPITRAERVASRRAPILASYDAKLAAFVDFVLAQYVAQGEAELDRDKLGSLLTLKYHTVIDAAAELGSVDLIRDTFIGFQPQLFSGAQG